ncbi:MAG: hypothetical protein KAU22_13010 [Desulfuromonadales bacterium]|nr:hypothetical protein [Desulfuromonadales bacterium]
MLSALSNYMSIANDSGSLGSVAERNNGSARINGQTEAESLRQKRTEQVQTLPGQDKTKLDGSPRDAVELSREAQEIRALQLRDREVRAHEAAHAAAGGSYAGSPSYTFARGADGKTYAVAGSVSIDVAPIKGDPEATLQKARQVRAAALAPAQPSGQDMKVAQRAQAMAAAAQSEISQNLNADLKKISPETDSGISTATQSMQNDMSAEIALANTNTSTSSSIAHLDIYT